jgi:CRP-like cAMP-binding protein
MDTTNKPNYVDLIIKMPLFAGLTVYGAQRLIDLGGIADYPAGTTLCHEGEEALVVILILTGKLRAYIEREGNELVVGDYGPGKIMGDIAALCGEVRAVSVKTLEPSTVLSWTNAAFRKLLLGDLSLSHRVFGSSLRMMLDHEKTLLQALAQKTSPPSPPSRG